MSYIEQYFGKKAEHLTFQDIIDFFQVEREESDKLELKSFYSSDNEKEKINGLLRSICAFLNSSGGLLIWGAPIGATTGGRTEKVFKGNLSPVTTLYEKDAFVGKIADSITPSPNLFTFCRIENNNNYIYLIEVTQSEYSPHQFKNTYYMRIDGHTRPAPHHYIEALFKKISYPKLKGYIKFRSLTGGNGSYYLTLSIIIFNLSKLQHEYKLFYRLVTNLGGFYVYQKNQNSYRSNNEIRETLSQTLYYNQPYHLSESLNFGVSIENPLKSSYTFMFYFGGERSPLLQSKYEIKIDPSSLKVDIISSEENIYTFEYSDGLQLSDEERMQLALSKL